MSHMFLDPEVCDALRGPLFPQWDLEGIRNRAEQARQAQIVDVPGARLEVTSFPAENGPQEIRLWRPRENTPRAVIFAIHGGGYTAGTAELDDLRNAEIADHLNVLVISPEYRLAPEFPFPAGPRDCLAALEWSLQLPETENIPIFLYGDSAGAGLVETVLVWHMEKHGRRIEGIIMLEPDIDPTMSSLSMSTQAHAPMWNREKTEASWACYLDGRSPDILPRLLPFADSPDFPRVVTFINPVDPLRDEGFEWTRALVEAGVCAELHLMPGTYHGTLSISGTTVWRRVQQIIADFLVGSRERFE
ncbi:MULTISPECIES: alpha/beta hydrolase fold domain-containing protein [unclassified Schaalia]|uniref:alpha/beta hydrolase fold domain-containing protein n=1 Tax=unclassified Schaalia TaxID=2691889 RepID=UPI001E4BB15F|nr:MULTISPECIES: alpha/beta hydrolase fold domain-containing protein [unclassified Schaalia]MCD4549263.1 alpha/beta hydrolase [Schaalia sp. lx-260]MCD4557072.1 alpha/beta hydrolase [Schaalia sp. lx-100]